MFSPIRFIQIGIAVYGHLFCGAGASRLVASHLTPAQKFSGMLERLGTPFVKLGQGLSMHTEFLPDDYVAALTSLQDQRPSRRAACAKSNNHSAVRRVIFEFNPIPLGSGIDCTGAYGPLARWP